MSKNLTDLTEDYYKKVPEKSKVSSPGHNRSGSLLPSIHKRAMGDKFNSDTDKVRHSLQHDNSTNRSSQMKSNFKSAISGIEFPSAQKVDAISIQKNIIDLIAIDHPDFDSKGPISLSELNYYRERYISETLKKQVGELSKLEKSVVETLGKGKQFTQKQLKEHADRLSYGQKLADKVATFGGSWTFIIFFGIVLFGWIILNAVFLSNKGFDPYPFISLNLILIGAIHTLLRKIRIHHFTTEFIVSLNLPIRFTII